ARKKPTTLSSSARPARPSPKATPSFTGVGGNPYGGRHRAASAFSSESIKAAARPVAIASAVSSAPRGFPVIPRLEGNQTGKDLPMKTYTVLFAQDIPHYGTVDIEAENDDHAIEAARIYWRDVENDPVSDPDWNSSVCKRIVEIADESGKAV